MTGSDVRLRNGPGTSGTTVKEYLNKGQTLTRIEKNKYNLDGLYWDRVITSGGLQGYVASNYLELVSKNDAFKIDGNNLICEPDTTVENVKAQHANAIIKNSSGTIITTGNIGTDYTVTIDNKIYVVIKLGDVNGDGRITPADSTVILRTYVGLNKLSDTKRIAADTNHDGKVAPSDSTIVLRNYVKLQEIKL